MSEDNRVLTMSPLVFVFVSLASMNVLGEPEEQPIKLEQGSLVLFHTVLVLQIGNSCSLFQLFTIFVEPLCGFNFGFACTLQGRDFTSPPYWSDQISAATVFQAAEACLN